MASSTDDPPRVTGGTIVSGTYVLTASTWYSKDAICNALQVGAQGQLRTTIEVDAAASKIEAVRSVCALGMSGTMSSTGSFGHTTLGSSAPGAPLFGYASSCGGGFLIVDGTDTAYTATPDSLTLFVPKTSPCNQVNFMYVEVYTKR